MLHLVGFILSLVRFVIRLVRFVLRPVRFVLHLVRFILSLVRFVFSGLSSVFLGLSCVLLRLSYVLLGLLYVLLGLSYALLGFSYVMSVFSYVLLGLMQSRRTPSLPERHTKLGLLRGWGIRFCHKKYQFPLDLVTFKLPVGILRAFASCPQNEQQDFKRNSSELFCEWKVSHRVKCHAFQTSTWTLRSLTWV